MKTKIILLGTGPAVPSRHRIRFDTSTLICLNNKNNLLIDCGEGTKYNLLKSKASSKINHIFFTHDHFDHIVGLTGLIGMLSLKTTSEITIHLYGSANTLDRAKKLIRMVRSEGNVMPLVSIVYNEIQNENEIDLDLVKVIPFNTFHKNDNSFGYCFLIKDSDSKKPVYKIAITGDTRYFDKLNQIVENSDIMIANTNFCENEDHIANRVGHLTTTQAAQIAKNAFVKKLYIQHISSKYSKNIEIVLENARKVFLDTYLGEDLLEIS